LLVAVLGARLGLRRDVGLAAGALLVAFPAAPEAVAWCSGIQDVLLTTCALTAVVAAIAMRRGGYAVAGLVILIALGVKETAICIPVLVALCLPVGWNAVRRRLLPLAALVGIVGTYVV